MQSKDRAPQCADMVNHPAHYKRGGIEALDVIDAWGLDFSLGNALKYIMRAGYKNDDAKEDLKKAVFYLQHVIDRLEAEQ